MGDVSDIFDYFLVGEGEGGVRGGGRGIGFFFENPRRGKGVSRTGAAEGPGGRPRRIGGFLGGGG